MTKPVVFILLSLVLVTVPAYGQRLPTDVTPEHYDLTFAVDLAQARFDGTETIRVRLSRATSKIVLHALDIQFGDVTIASGGTAQQATVMLDQARQTATLAVQKSLPAGPAEIRITYAGTLNDKLRGFYLSAGRGRKYAVTQFESTDARRAFPCFDEPAFKATFAVTLTIDRGDTAISNGTIVSDTPSPDGKRHTLTFSTSPRMSSYLVAMAVGNFECVEGRTDGIPIRVCATPDKKDLTGIALESAVQMLAFYNNYFTIKYPYGKLDILGVPDFAAGAMENTAAIFFRDADLLADAANASVATRKNIASIVAHEMAHQWFGDLVTMRWWDDIWLNEGFATWMANRPLAAWKPEWNIAVAEELETQAALNVDSLKSTRAVHNQVNTPAEIDGAFDTIAYEKGAAILRMIESFVGRETFRQGVNAYLTAHAYGNAESADFWRAIATASGKSVDRIMPTFINQPGVPLLAVSLACEAGRTKTTLAQQRFVADAAPGRASSKERWQIPLCIKTDQSSGESCPVLSEAAGSISLAAGGCASWVFANASAQGYFRTAYPPEMLRAIAPHVETSLSAPERLSLLADEWALVRAGRHSATDYLTLVSGYGREPSAGVLSEIADRLGLIHDYLTTDVTRPRFEAFVRSLLQPVLAQVGFAPAPEDDDERREIREVVVNTLSTTGNDPVVVSSSLEALKRALNGGSSAASARSNAVVRVAAAHGDEKLFEQLAAAADRATSPEEHERFLHAAAYFRDPALIERGLQRSLTPEIRNQDAPLYLARFLDNPVARPRAWSFLKENWVALEPKVTIFGGDTNLVRALGSFCDAASRDDISQFFAAHPLPAAARTLDQTVERINNCIALKRDQTNAVSDWLAAR
jgi:aminopeptidase N